MSDPNEIKLEPDRNRLAQAIAGAQEGQFPSLHEFYGMMSPKTHGSDFQALGHPDAVDNFLNTIGVTTDRVAKFRQAYVVEQQLEPVYRNLSAKWLGERMETPTVGEAQQLVPGMPVQESAMRPSTVELSGPGAPELRSDAEYNQVDPTLPDSTRNYTEGPRPTGPGPLVVDKSQLLSPPFKEQFDQKMKQSSLRPFAGNFCAEAMNEYEDIMAGVRPERFEGHAGKLAAFLGIEHKNYAKGSVGGRLADAKATSAEAQAQRADEMVGATIEQKRSATGLSNARTTEIGLLQDAKLAHLKAMTEKALKDATLSGNQAAMLEARERLMKISAYKVLSATDDISPEERTTFFSSIFKGTDLEAVPEDPGMIRSFLGLGSTGTKITPRVGGAPAAPAAQAPVEAPPLEAPPKGTAAPVGGTGGKDDKKAQAKALFNRMKEDEVQMFDGHKYRKKGGQLVPEK